MTDNTQAEALAALIERFRGLHIDHEPDGWPAVRTREITALLDRIAELEAQLEAIGAGGVSGPLMGASLAASAGSEPVAEMVPFHTPSGKRVAVISRFQHLPIGTKLYTHPYPPEGMVADLKTRLLTALERAGAAESLLRNLVDECDNDSIVGWEERMATCIDSANRFLSSHSPPEGAGWTSVDERLPEPNVEVLCAGQGWGDPYVAACYYDDDPPKPLYLAAPPTAQAEGWTKLPGTLPKPGTPVLLDIGKEFPIRAMWAAKHTVEAADDDTDWGEYDEATDEYWCPEGWYEWNEHEEVHWAVSETPRAWRELPQPLPAAPGPTDGESNG